MYAPKLLFRIMYILLINFCVISFSRTQNLYFLKNSGKIVTTVPSSNLCSQKLNQYHISKFSILHAKFCMIPCHRTVQVSSTPSVRRQRFDAWSVRREIVSTRGQFDAILFFLTFIYFQNKFASSFK